MPIAPRDDLYRPLTSDLQIDLDGLEGSGPYYFRQALPVEWLRLALGATDADLRDAGEVRLELTRQGEGAYLLRGELDANFVVPCARCLTDANVVVPRELCVTVDASGSVLVPAHDGADIEAAEDDGVDRLIYTASTLDLAEWLAEHISVAYPMRALCFRGEACAGLCGTCGLDLNKVAAGELSGCGCAQALAEAFGTSETPWRRALKKLEHDPS